jgi:hypothetical protein
MDNLTLAKKRIAFLKSNHDLTNHSITQDVQPIQVRPPAESARYVRIRQAAESSQSILVRQTTKSVQPILERTKERTHQEKVEIISKYHILKNGVQDSVMFPSQITPQMKVHEFFNILQMSEIERNNAIDGMEKEIEKIVNKQNKDLENEVLKIKDGLYDIIMNNNIIILDTQYPFFTKGFFKRDIANHSEIVIDNESILIFNEHIRNKINHLHYDKNIISEKMNEIIRFLNKLLNDKLLKFKLKFNSNKKVLHNTYINSTIGRSYTSNKQTLHNVPQYIGNSTAENIKKYNNIKEKKVMFNEKVNDKEGNTEHKEKINFEKAVQIRLKKIKEERLKEERAKEQALFLIKVEQEVQRRLKEEEI